MTELVKVTNKKNRRKDVSGKKRKGRKRKKRIFRNEKNETNAEEKGRNWNCFEGFGIR